MYKITLLFTQILQRASEGRQSHCSLQRITTTGRTHSSNPYNAKSITSTFPQLFDWKAQTLKNR